MSGGVSASMISGFNFFCLSFTNEVLRWRFLGDLHFGWFYDDLFSMKVNTDGTTFGFNVFMWRPALKFISVILKWNSHTYVLFVTKRIFPTNSSKCFDFITPQFIQFWLYIFIWKFKHTYVRFLAIFFIMCILAQWNTTVLPFPTYIQLFWSFQNSLFIVHCGFHRFVW